MRDHVEIGSAPYDEPCVQVNPEGNYHDAMKAECRRFLELTRKKLGPEPQGAWLSIKSNSHDFGTYYEVVCNFYDDEPEAVAYAFNCEAMAPRTWGDDHLSQDEEARIKTHKAELEGKCLQCGERFEDPELLHAHIREHVQSSFLVA